MRFFTLLIFILVFNVYANEKVTLQLKWLHQFQFAGYYAAKEKGFYNEVGLDVEIKQRNIKKNNIEQVLNGEAEYGISDSVLLLYKAKNRPVVIVSPIFQHSPGVILTLKSSGLDSPYKLQNKDIIFYRKDTDGFGILTMLDNLHVNVNLDRIKYKTDYKELIEKKTDAFPIYLTNEMYYFKQANIEVNIINPSHYGVDLYGDMIFTNQNEAKNHPKRVERFKKASIKGWYYALTHKEEIVQLIKNKYAKDKSIDHLRFESKATEDMIRPNSIPIGTLDRGRIQFILNMYEKQGLIQNNIKISDYIFESFYKKINLTDEELKWIKNNQNITFNSRGCSKEGSFFYKNDLMKNITLDYLNFIGKTLNTKIKLCNDKKDKKVYGYSGIFKTPENEKKYLLTKPYMYTNFVIFFNKNDKNNYHSLQDLQYKKIAVLKYDKIMREYFSKIKGVKLIYANNPTDQMSMLEYEEVDAIVGYRSYHSIVKKNLFTNIAFAFSDNKKIPICFAINKDYKILHNVLNKALEVLTPEKQINIISKWITNLNFNKKDIFNKQENKYLKNKKVLTMCVNPNWMPFEKIQDSKHTGIASDYIKLVQKELNIPIKLVQTKSWFETLEYLKQRKCDITALAMATKQRRQYLNFTKPYLSIPLVIVTRIDEFFINSIDSIVDKKIGITRGFAYAEILKDKYPDINLVPVDGIEEGLKKVKNKELFGFIDSLITTGYHIQEDYIGTLKIGGKFDERWNLGIGTRNDEPILESIINKAVNQISPEQKQKILTKWVSVSYDHKMNYMPIIKWALLALAIFGTIIFIIMRINQKLKNEIQIRKDTEKKLKDISVTDELTTLYNRRYFNTILPKLINGAKRDDATVCFAIMDIDFFKLYNDTYGHIKGDEALKEVSLCIKHSLSRADDYCFRLGGEEFGLLFKGLDRDHSINFMQKVKDNIENLKIKHEHNRASKYVTASFGLVIRQAKSIQDYEELYKEADDLLYRAKDRGRNRICVN